MKCRNTKVHYECVTCEQDQEVTIEYNNMKIFNKTYLGQGWFFKFQQDLGNLLLKYGIIKRSVWKSPNILFRYYFE